jgi:hypothetical protein
MPTNNVADLITDQEMAFARLVLDGSMNDREAAQAAGLNPDTAAYTKSKPRVRAYMLEHRAAVQQQFVEQEAEALRRLTQRREQVLDRLMELANMSPDLTRGSITGQVKAITMVVAIDGMISGRRAGASVPQRASSPPDKTQIYAAEEWLAKQQEKAIQPEPSPALAQEEAEPGLVEPEPAPALAGDPPPLPGITPAITFDPISFAFAPRVNPWENKPSAPVAPLLAYALDTRVPYSTKKN